ncbi:MAG TPA: UDP-2,4-diacetamido-2,4,6-trideoxy-beta-L-altropyranose hydrolase [Sedimenticola sp.]|nr:UDP-2,4-diacetamido-2,4,6-trideoxy-beta-L-altropyranose hydrolase [Sedimenticola sp.]
MIRVAFRVDSSRQIGSGHAMRCATLAGLLRQRGAEVVFVCRELDGNYCDWLEAQGHAVHRLPVPAIGEPLDGRLAHATWLGVTQARDSAETREALAGGTWDWLIVDHYGLDAEWETAMRPTARRIMAIDDLADRRHDVDLLLDQNVVEGVNDRYLGRVPEHCGLLLGPAFALLQAVYAQLHQASRSRATPMRRLFIFFGGVDPQNLTGLALQAVRILGRTDLTVDAVIGANNPHANVIRRVAAEVPQVRLHYNLPSLAPLMAEADLAIGAGGTASWERCCLGLPSLIITFAANQVPLAVGLSNLCLARWLGEAGKIDAQVLSHAISEALDDEALLEYSVRCHALVDGRGAERAISVMQASGDLEMHLRPAIAGDEKLLLRWANDPLVRRNAFDQNAIDSATHHLWFRDRLSEVDRFRIFIAETQLGIPVGQVRFERQKSYWSIDYSLDAAFRGAGLGKRLLGDALAELARQEPNSQLLARVKLTNHPSRRVFESLGFVSSNKGGIMVFSRAAADQGEN